MGLRLLARFPHTHLALTFVREGQEAGLVASLSVNGLEQQHPCSSSSRNWTPAIVIDGYRRDARAEEAHGQ
jgi:hypothetical protein